MLVLIQYNIIIIDNNTFAVQDGQRAFHINNKNNNKIMKRSINYSGFLDAVQKIYKYEVINTSISDYNNLTININIDNDQINPRC